MKKLNKAEIYLLKSAAICNIKGPPFDGAVTHENLAQLGEIETNLPKVKQICPPRAPDNLACGYCSFLLSDIASSTLFNQFQCADQMFKLSDLKHSCCKVSSQVPKCSPSPGMYPQAVVYYCSMTCQVSFFFLLIMVISMA